jgi:AcrR family transcriptional regulator
MEHRTPRAEQKAQTKKAIVDAALSCFSQQGLRETTIGAIASAAGVAHGTFYVHFASKDALLDELLQGFNSGLVQQLAPLWLDQRPDTLPRQIHASAETFLAYWTEHRGFVEAYGQKVAAGIRLADLRHGLARPVMDLLARQIERLAADAGATLPHAELVAQSLLALWARVGLHHLFDGDIERAQAADLLTRMTLGALQGLVPAIAEAWDLER